MSSEPSEPSQSAPKPPRTEAPDRILVTVGMAAVAGVVLWAWLGEDSFGSASSSSLAWVLDNFGWLFVVAADVFLVLCLVIAFGRFGRIRLGEDGSEPEFGNLAWIAMMFSAGMGIGLMFYGVGEPLTHFLEPPPASGVRAGSGPAARTALEYSFFHWTLTPWAIYGMWASPWRTRCSARGAATGSVPRSCRSSGPGGPTGGRAR